MSWTLAGFSTREADWAPFWGPNEDGKGTWRSGNDEWGQNCPGREGPPGNPWHSFLHFMRSLRQNRGVETKPWTSTPAPHGGIFSGLIADTLGYCACKSRFLPWLRNAVAVVPLPTCFSRRAGPLSYKGIKYFTLLHFTCLCLAFINCLFFI